VKKHVVIGGTGTLGRSLISHLLNGKDLCEIICVSRDELKQKEVKAQIVAPPHLLRFEIGDVRDLDRMRQVVHGATSVFHVAAMKHIDVVQDHPLEGLKTNTIGSANIAQACIEQKVSYCVLSSTDKAVEPTNIYGMTKAIAEKHFLSLNEKQTTTKFSVFRWGNVLGSRGSVIHLFKKSLLEKKAVDITHPRMSRFWIHIDDAVSFMLANYKHAPTDRPCIPRMKACLVTNLAKALSEILGVSDASINLVGMREGEKLAEKIDEGEDFCSATAPQFTKEELIYLIQRANI
jgi:UDP-N-acetylglucosamine 4,6-dehydratase